MNSISNKIMSPIKSSKSFREQIKQFTSRIKIEEWQVLGKKVAPDRFIKAQKNITFKIQRVDTLALIENGLTGIAPEWGLIFKGMCNYIRLRLTRIRQK